MDEKELNIENENENENETTEVITDTEKEETSVKEDEPEKENKPVKKESVKKAKKPMSRKMKHSLISGAICIFVAAAVVLLNIISFTLTSKYSLLIHLGSEPTTSARPPVLIKGTPSEATKSMFFIYTNPPNTYLV